MSLQLLIDNGDPKVWEELTSTGLFSGITTNPSLLRRAKQSCRIEQLKKLAKHAESLGYKELHLQAWGRSQRELVLCGSQLDLLKTKQLKIYVKIPVTFTGSQAAKVLIEKGISVTLTACYDAKQIIIASGLGASYIAPYLGRINDLGVDGIQELKRMQKVLDGLGSTCKLLVASIRNPKEIIELASEGINTFTISHKIAKELYEVSATIIAEQQFNNDAMSTQ
ncbi:transaldolase family protein [Prochlorococcus sp. MIT 1341]|uniref:transaldolase family protein n=1 Tax=Prochlorococcus sp. MIT 1341 TaxID=3096221 RepID=UPI002A754603|nr:transaldolase family protein [Prochlorococcus sp. MIT 1341]